MENEEKGITLGRVLKVAFSNWKLLILVAAIVMTASVLGINYGLNTLRGSYRSTFSYSSNDLKEESYADGSSFYYKNLISRSSLLSVKESDEKYASIDVDRILNNNGINVTSNPDNKTYTITLAYRYIKDYSVAKSFINDIVGSPLKKDADIVKNGSFDNSLKLFDEADTFEQQVEYLAQEAASLKTSYSNLQNSDVSIKETIEANSKKISLLIGDDFVMGMKYRINKGGFVKDYNSSEAKSYEIKKLQLQEEKSLNQAKIDALEDEINSLTVTTAISTLSTQMESLILKNEDIKYEVDGIDAKLANKGKDPSTIEGYTDFVNDLSSYRSLLSNAVDDYRAVLKSAYVDSAEVAFENSSVITVNGTISIYINVAASLVLGIVVGAAVNLIVDRKKLYE